MVQRYKLIGAFALVLCLAAVSFAIIAEDSEQADADPVYDMGELSTALNTYADLLLGNTQEVFFSEYDSTNDEFEITYYADAEFIQTISLDLVDPFDEFMDCMKDAGVQTLTIKFEDEQENVYQFDIIEYKGGQVLLNRGAALDFVLSFLYYYDDGNGYDGDILVNGEISGLNIYIASKDGLLLSILQELYALQFVNIVPEGGALSLIKLNMIEEVAMLLGFPNIEEFQTLSLLDIAELLQTDVADDEGAIAGLFTADERDYIDQVCGTIVGATGLAEFIEGVFTLTVNDIDITFGTPTISAKQNLEGLVDTIYTAMLDGENFDKTISELEDSSAAGTLSFVATLTWNGGEASGTIVKDQNVDVEFGCPATVAAAQVSGGTIEITPANDGFVCWDEIEIKCTASSGYSLSSVKCIIGEDEFNLEKKSTQTFQIPYYAKDKDVTITAKFSSNPGPGPGPSPSKYTVRFSPTEGGSVQPTMVIVDKDATITTEANVMKVGTYTVTATPDKGYVFKSWSVTTGTVTSNMTIAVTFEKGEPTEPILVVDDEGTVYIPADVVQTLGIKDPEKLELTIASVQPATPNVPENAVCYSVTLVYDGKALKQFSDYIDVALSFTPPYGADISKFKVYFVSDDGRTVEDMHATYDSFSHAMVFKIPHLSTFAITDQVIEPIPAVLQSISVKTAPAKVSYTTGDCFDPTGLVISLKYDDGSSLDLAYKGNESQFTFNPSTTTALKTTDKSVTITHEGKTTTQAITVSDPAPEPSSGGDNTVLIIVIVIIVILVIAAGVFFYMKKKA